MNDDERIIEDLEILQNINWSKAEQATVWDRLRDMIGGNSDAEELSQHQDVFNQQQLYIPKTSHPRTDSHSFEQPAARHQNTISMNADKSAGCSKPTGKDGRL